MLLSSKKISGQRLRDGDRNRNGEKLNAIPSSAQKKAIRDAFLRELENGPMKRWDQDGSSQFNLLADDNEDIHAKLEDEYRAAHFNANRSSQRRVSWISSHLSDGSTQRRVSWVSSPLLCIGICLLFKTRKYHHQINFIC